MTFVNVEKTFFFVDEDDKQARVFVPGKTFQLKNDTSLFGTFVSDEKNFFITLMISTNVKKLFSDEVDK